MFSQDDVLGMSISFSLEITWLINIDVFVQPRRRAQQVEFLHALYIAGVLASFIKIYTSVRLKFLIRI